MNGKVRKRRGGEEQGLWVKDGGRGIKRIRELYTDKGASRERKSQRRRTNRKHRLLIVFPRRYISVSFLWRISQRHPKAAPTLATVLPKCHFFFFAFSLIPCNCNGETKNR